MELTQCYRSTAFDLILGQCEVNFHLEVRSGKTYMQTTGSGPLDDFCCTLQSTETAFELLPLGHSFNVITYRISPLFYLYSSRKKNADDDDTADLLSSKHKTIADTQQHKR